MIDLERSTPVESREAPRAKSRQCPLSIHEVLEHHDRFAGATPLMNVLGDGYLYSQNSIFRNVRELALRAGFSFTDAPTFGYSQLPLLCLEDIWRTRTIPFIENVQVLRAVERAAPSRMNYWEVAALGLRRTPTFHESMHCVARSVLRGLPQETTELSADSCAILELLFEESCANASEVICAAGAEAKPHRLFARMNLYEHPLGAASVIARIGCGNTLKLLIVAFLLSNFLYDSVPATEVRRIAEEFVSSDELDLLGERRLLRLFRRAFMLHPSFRFRTTGTNLKFAGFSGDLFDLLDFQFFGELRAGRRLHEALSIVADLVEYGRAAASAGRLAANAAMGPSR